jgi:hypothetical protein
VLRIPFVRPEEAALTLLGNLFFPGIATAVLGLLIADNSVAVIGLLQVRDLPPIGRLLRRGLALGPAAIAHPLLPPLAPPPVSCPPQCLQFITTFFFGFGWIWAVVYSFLLLIKSTSGVGGENHGKSIQQRRAERRREKRKAEREAAAASVRKPPPVARARVKKKKTSRKKRAKKRRPRA